MKAPLAVPNAPRVRPNLQLLALALASLSTAGAASAHAPSASHGAHTNIEEAFYVAYTSQSIVVYHEVTCDAEQLWLYTDAGKTESAWVQLGVPVVDWLEGYRPSLAVLASELPEPPGNLPFETPDWAGVTVIETTDLADPEVFFEPVTETESWVLIDQEIELPGTGAAFFVAWHPERLTGKLWVAIGTEPFDSADPGAAPAWLENMRQFHELGDDVAPSEQVVCDDDDAIDAPELPDHGGEPGDEPGEGGGEGGVQSPTGAPPISQGEAPAEPDGPTEGCAAGGSGELPWALLASIIVVVATRRR